MLSLVTRRRRPDPASPEPTAPPPDNSPGRQLLALRTRAGLGLVTVASASGIRLSRLERIESGATKPDLADLVAIGWALVVFRDPQTTDLLDEDAVLIELLCSTGLLTTPITPEHRPPQPAR